ncbi:hypothetical protein NDU88_004917 [Pleurodeles waltl]|uniref:Uncharacterized protein n=1 Tax=Pleurodeles waltl TaxID=8319 RepID=A0AAV7NMF8_PLEWA|nr:hypothetical protein NDU88_004917 [Pleurodeles waltl]
MEAGLDSILRRLRLQTGGSAGAGGGAASGGGRLQPFLCSLRGLPTGAAAGGSGPTVSGAGGSACGGACGGAAGGAGCGAGAGAASGGGRLQPFSCSLGRLPTGDAAADSSGASGGAACGAGGGVCGGAAGGADLGAGGRAGGYAVVTLALVAGVLEEALLGGSYSLSLQHSVPFFTLAGGGLDLSFVGFGGTLAGLAVAPFEPL